MRLPEAVEVKGACLPGFAGGQLIQDGRFQHIPFGIPQHAAKQPHSRACVQFRRGGITDGARLVFGTE